MKDYTPPALRDIPLTTVMQALSDPCRLRIMQALLAEASGELACGDIPLRISKATRSHHFDVLFNAGLIAKRPVGTKCMTSVRAVELERRFPGLLTLVRPPSRKA